MRSGARAAVAAGAAAAQTGLLEKRESIYNNIFIFGDTDSVTMTFGHNKRYYTESGMKLSDPGALTVEYTRLMTVGLAYAPKVERILEIGLGGGRTVSYLNAALPDTAILAVEIDKDVVDLAKKYFSFKESGEHARGGGRRPLVPDARQRPLGHHPDRRLPRAVRAVPPADQGVLHAGEVAARAGRGGGAEHRALDHAVRIPRPRRSTACFPSVDLYDGGGNVVAVGYDGPSAAPGRPDGARQPRCRRATICATICAPWSAARRVLGRPTGKVLTDDFAPVETMRAIEQNNEKWKDQTEAPR